MNQDSNQRGGYYEQKNENTEKSNNYLIDSP